MDRKQLRLKEAAALLDLGLADGAFYLAGYAVECALKVCIAKSTRRGEFPDRDKAALVSVDISKGSELLEALERANLKVSVALYEDWRLRIAATDPFIRQLRRIFGKTKSVHGMRLGNQMVGDRFVQDAYVYRISWAGTGRP